MVIYKKCLYLLRNTNIYPMQIFCIGSLFLASLLSTNPLNAIPLSCISLKNQKCKVTPKIIDINSNNPIFYPFSIKINRSSAIVIILMIRMEKFLFLIL